ncbi:MAG: efflux RND transporter periplasmic adaptor subunit [Actinomycetota bacterium]|nr:efflux RND transporter periplasmic adaptor subunit [Actinomycetota bacterium]
MRKSWLLAGAAVLVAVTATTGGVIAMSSAKQATAGAQEPPANTATVEKGKLSAMVSQYGTLTYRARSDGSPYSVINQARGTYTKLPADGDKIDCGDVLYRVDDKPVLLLCGSTPAYRSLLKGDSGADVTELNANLVHLGYATRARLDPSSDHFTSEPASALKRLQRDRGEAQTESLDLGQAVFLPESVRIAKVTGELGGPSQPGAQVLYATSDTLEVRVSLDPSQQSEVKTGEPAQITLPDNHTTPGTVTRIGTVASSSGSGSGSSGPGSGSSSPTIPIYITLKYPKAAGSLDLAPVQVQITTAGVKNALSVPVTAVVGKSGGGFAVEVVRAGGRHELVAVQLGLFDTAGGRVEVEGDLRQGDRVVVPSP